MKLRNWTAGLAVIGLLSVAHATLGSPGRSPLEKMRSILSRTSGDTRSRDDVVEQLVRMGPESIPELFQTYTGENIEPLLGEAQFNAESWWCAPDEFGALSLSALSEMPTKPLFTYLKKQTQAGASVEIKLCAIRVLGARGSAQGLPLLFNTASKEGARSMRYRSISGAFEDALGNILAADSKSFDVLEDRVDELSTDLLALSIEATRKADRPEGVEFLVAVMGRDPQLDIAALEASAEICRRFPWRIRVDPRRHVRGYLGSKNSEIRRAAVIATGRIHDTGAFLELVGMLEDPDPDVRRSASWSLEQLTGETYLDSEEEWTRWLELDEKWWITEGGRLRSELEADDPRRVTAAARTLAQRTFHRDEVTLDICEVLAQQGPLAIAQLCVVLSAVDSAHAVPTLVDLLFDKNPKVRAAAGAALERITGRKLPPEPWIWEKYANG